MKGHVVIAGAGWRVKRFVVPALLAAGIRTEQILVLRRRGGFPLSGYPEVDTVADPARLPAASEVALTINCVTASSLVDVQRTLQARYPHAVHFVDTPIFAESDRLFRVLVLRSRRLYSLEDWPFLPNLVHLAALVRDVRGHAMVRLEHFGIPLHFLAWYRSLRGNGPLSGRKLRRDEQTVRGSPRAGVRVLFRLPKIPPLAKWSFESENALVEDFHEVNPAHGSSDEVVHRIVAGDAVSYHRGRVCFHREDISSDLLATFAPLNDRRNVHELDKFVALVGIFRSITAGDRIRTYSFLNAVRDTLTLRRLEAKAACALR